MRFRWGVGLFAQTLFFLTIFLGTGLLFFPRQAEAISAADRFKGYVLLQIEQHAEAWYIDPSTETRTFLGRPADALNVVRKFGLGVTNQTLSKIPLAGSTENGNVNLRRKLSGRILLQVEDRGQAWYVYPRTQQRYALGRPADAWRVMTQLGLGVRDADLFLLTVEKNLDIPFTSQAPNGLWDFDHDNFCEEASVLMTARYLQGRGIAGPADAEAELQRLKAWEVSNLGYHKDTSADDTARVVRSVYGLTATVYPGPTLTSIRGWIDEGSVVITPLAGRQIGNRHFRNGGPVYHMFVIKGYTNDGWFITNEPGTRYGADYRYRQDVIMSALHDFNDGNVVQGMPRVIVVSKL